MMDGRMACCLALSLAMRWKHIHGVCCPRQGLLFDLTITGGVTTSDGGTNAKVYPASSGITPDRILAGEV